MIIFQIILLTLITKLCQTEFKQAFHVFTPDSAPLVAMCPFSQQHQPRPLALQPISVDTAAVEKPKDNLKFNLPFLDMEIQCDRSVHIMQEMHKQQIYILHGHELYQMFINRQEKRLSLVGMLEGGVRFAEPLGAKLIYWRGNILLVIALEEHLEIYQLDEHILSQRAEYVKDAKRAHEPPPVFEAIQQLTLTGRFQELFLLNPSKDRVIIVAIVNFTKLYGKLRIFEWFNTYFDPIEEITVPTIQVVNVIGSQIKYLITGHTIKHQAKTIVNVYEINPISLQLLMKQTLTVESRVVHVFTYQNRNMIVACSKKQQKCNSFRQMSDGHFAVYRQRSSNEFAFDLMSSSTRFVSATRLNHIMVFTNHRLDCYASFTADRMDVTDLIAYQNDHKENYVLLLYKTPFKVLLRIVELEINVEDSGTGNLTETEEILASTRHQHLFETTVGSLRSILLKRKVDMDLFRKVANILRPKIKNLEVKEPIVVNEGRVDALKIIGESLRSPIQIIQKIENLRQTYLAQRTTRSADQEFLNKTTDMVKRAKVHKMRVKNVNYQGVVLEGFSLSRTNFEEKVLNIKGKVSTYALNTSELVLPHALRRNTLQQNSSDFVPPVRVSHLKVDFINGIAWQTFYDSLFLKNRDKSIQGRLVFQAQVNVTNLMSTILNGFMVANLFNLKHPQVIHSNLVLTHLYVHNLKAQTVNGLIFEEDIVFSGQESFIETPVKIHHLNISGDLFLPNNTQSKLPDNPTDEFKFAQFYTKQIIVNGSLIINNLKRSQNKTKIILEDLEFNEKTIKEKYLLKQQAQHFSFPVNFEEAKVTVPLMETTYLNDYTTEEHMLVDKLDRNKNLMAIFMNAHVKGDIWCKDFKSRIADIQENIIRPGDKFEVTGLKIFEAPLEVNNVAEISSLNEVKVTELVFKSLSSADGPVQFKDLKVFNTIKVKSSAVIDTELKASYLNNLPLETLLNNDYYADSLTVTHLVEAVNLVFHKINGIPYEEFFTEMHVKNQQLVLHKNVIVEGNIEFAEALELKYINDILWQDYMENLVLNNENAVVEGDVSFNSDLTITQELKVSEINGYNLDFILQNVLLKTKPQWITGSYKFHMLNGSNINALEINKVNFTEIIDSTKSLIEIEGDMVVHKLIVKGNLQGNLKGFESLLNWQQKLNELPAKPWQNLKVLNNASWPLNVTNNEQHDLLKYFYKTAVKSNQEQTITGSVKMTKPTINKMQTRSKFPFNVDFAFIQQDGLLKNCSQPQHIKGLKVFHKPVYMESLNVSGQLNALLLNAIDVLHFNQTLYRLSTQEPLQGPFKFLQPLTVSVLNIKGLINNLNSSLIYQLHSNESLPALKLSELYVENDLFIKNVNELSLSYFLNNRLTVKGPATEYFGVLTFENLIIEKELRVQNINGLSIDNLVFKHSPYLQTITGHKSLKNTLELAGPAHVITLNNKDLLALYRNTLKQDLNYKFDYLLIQQPKFENGLQVINDNVNLQQQPHTFRVADEYEGDQLNRENFLEFLKEFKLNLSLSSKAISYLAYDSTANLKWLADRDSIKTLANQTILYELSRISCCAKKFVQISFESPNTFYLKNFTSQRLAKISNKIALKAENFCKIQNHKVKSKVAISSHKLLKVFGMKRYLENFFILDNLPNSANYDFVILHALDLPLFKRNEIRIFKVAIASNTIKEWQSLVHNIGKQVKLFKFSNLHLLVTNGLIKQQPAVTIYHFNYTSQLFQMQQTIDGDYDIMEMLELPNNAGTKQLLLTCAKCQRIFIYSYLPASNNDSSRHPGKYEIFQIINLERFSIDKLQIFCLNNATCYMLIITPPNTNLYYIYKYCYIQGWLPLTMGHFPNMQMSLPLAKMWSNDKHLINSKSFPNGIPLIIFCNFHNCYLVKAIV